MILTNESIKAIQEKAARYPRAKSAILPAITIAYRQVGHLNDEIYSEISDVINVPVLEIAGVTMEGQPPLPGNLLVPARFKECSIQCQESMICHGIVLSTQREKYP